MDRAQTELWLRITAQMMHDSRDRLTELDKQIGDADHGINMDRGFQRLAVEIDGQPDGASDLAGLLETASLVLISTVGGASGPLYGTLFLRASVSAAGKERLSALDMAALFEAGLAGVQQRGRSRRGDKTMIDALAPAVDALKEAAASGADARTAVEAAVEAAAAGAEATIPLVARKGRASYLGERSAGHMDPGAASTVILLQALQRALS